MTKREVHPALRGLLNLDVALTNQFVSSVEKIMPIRSLKVHYKALEMSCHGIVWLVGWLAFIYMVNSPKLYQMQVNLYLGLILDIIVVGLLKAIVRRRRPALNVPDMPATFGPDVYSFPSGHVTRSVFLAVFFTYLYPVPLLMRPPFLAWVVAVSVSRVLLRRHHLLDVIAGAVIGLLEGLIISVLWLGQDTSAALVSMLAGTDDSYMESLPS